MNKVEEGQRDDVVRIVNKGRVGARGKLRLTEVNDVERGLLG